MFSYHQIPITYHYYMYMLLGQRWARVNFVTITHAFWAIVAKSSIFSVSILVTILSIAAFEWLGTQKIVDSLPVQYKALFLKVALSKNRRCNRRVVFYLCILKWNVAHKRYKNIELRFFFDWLVLRHITVK